MWLNSDNHRYEEKQCIEIGNQDNKAKANESYRYRDFNKKAYPYINTEVDQPIVYNKTHDKKPNQKNHNNNYIRPRAFFLRMWQCLAWAVIRNKDKIFFRRGVRCYAKVAVGHVMNGVIALEKGGTKDKKVLLVSYNV